MPNLSRKGKCSAPECDKPIHARRMCVAHYAAWYWAGKKATENAKRRANPLSNAERVAAKMQQAKECVECGITFFRPRKLADAQWTRRHCCSTSCANAIRARGRERRPGDLSRRDQGKDSYNLEWQRRRKMPRWAAWWEQRRLAEDVADLAVPATSRGGPCCRTSQRPKVRQFTGCWCSDCGSAFVADNGRYNDCNRCLTCNRKHWQRLGVHRKRARHYGATYEPVNRIAVFRADGWKCQLCGTRVLRKAGRPRSATLDHIIPLAAGGHHTLDNVQTACAHCNFTKGANAANDQLRLAV